MNDQTQHHVLSLKYHFTFILIPRITLSFQMLDILPHFDCILQSSCVQFRVRALLYVCACVCACVLLIIFITFTVYLNQESKISAIKSDDKLKKTETSFHIEACDFSRDDESVYSHRGTRSHVRLTGSDFTLRREILSLTRSLITIFIYSHLSSQYIRGNVQVTPKAFGGPFRPLVPLARARNFFGRARACTTMTMREERIQSLGAIATDIRVRPIRLNVLLALS